MPVLTLFVKVINSAKIHLVIVRVTDKITIINTKDKFFLPLTKRFSGHKIAGFCPLKRFVRSLLVVDKLVWVLNTTPIVLLSGGPFHIQFSIIFCTIT